MPTALTRKRASGARGRRLGHRAELLHQRERVPAEPRLARLALDDPRERDPGHRHLLAGRRHAHQLARVRAARRPARGDELTFGDLIIDRDRPVREPGQVRGDELPEARGVRKFASEPRSATFAGETTLRRWWRNGGGLASAVADTVPVGHQRKRTDPYRTIRPVPVHTSVRSQATAAQDARITSGRRSRTSSRASVPPTVARRSWPAARARRSSASSSPRRPRARARLSSSPRPRSLPRRYASGPRTPNAPSLPRGARIDGGGRGRSRVDDE
jgi:hypothetical protein